jgi:hypothetical protein
MCRLHLDKRKLNICKLVTLIPLFALCTSGNAESPSKDSIADVNSWQVVKIPQLPEKISFAGENVPLMYTDVREALQREMTVISYWHGSLSYIIQLDNRYRREIMKVLKEEGVSEDFYYLCIAESGLQPVVSPAGAAGYWQFLISTAKESGLVVDNEVDERYNIEKSTRAASAYFKKAREEFGNWTLAAASFNIGMNDVRYRIKIQNQSDYYNMQFPEETGRYLFRALAFKIIMADPGKYGFFIDKDQLFDELKYKEVEVKGAVENWSQFASQYKTNFKLLKIYNQWIRSNALVNKANRTYIVKVPLEGYR